VVTLKNALVTIAISIVTNYKPFLDEWD